MTFDLKPFLMITEIGLVALSMLVLILDVCLKDNKKVGTTLANIAIAGLSVLLVHLALNGQRFFGVTLNGAFVQDGLAYYFKIFFLLTGIVVLFISKNYVSHLKRGHEEFTLLVLFALTGMHFLVSSRELLLFFVSLEILTVSSYIMTSYLRDNEASIEAGAKYLVLGAVSTAFFLMGLSYVYGASGSTFLGDIAALITSGQAPTFLTFGLALVMASLFFKIAAVPFHFWAPDVYEGAPTPVTAFLAIGSKAAGFAAILRLFATGQFYLDSKILLIVSVLSAASIFYGNLGAIQQKNIKRLLAYSSIGHAGYLMIGLVAFSVTGKTALLYYLAAYFVSTGGAFLVILALTPYMRTDAISEYAGLSKRSPLMAAGMLMALLSLAGLPPLAGFFSKFYILWAGVEAGILWLVIIGLINVVVSLYTI